MNTKAYSHADLDPLGRAGYLQSLELYQAVSSQLWTGISLTLNLRTNGENGSDCFSVVFHNVQGLRLGPIDGLRYYYVEILPAIDRQLENVNYHIIESEYETLSFFCENFQIMSDYGDR